MNTKSSTILEETKTLRFVKKIKQEQQQDWDEDARSQSINLSRSFQGKQGGEEKKMLSARGERKRERQKKVHALTV